MELVPLLPVPAQTQRTVLGGQDARLTVYERRAYEGRTPYPALYVDVALGGRAIVTGCLARNRVRLVRDAYLGLVGDLVFVDLLGSDDPLSAGLGARWVLLYLADPLEGYVPPAVPTDEPTGVAGFLGTDFSSDFLG